MGKPGWLAEDQRRTLDRLSAVGALRGFYLAGGTAVAYHLGHRRSLDLDLFSADATADLDQVLRDLRALDDVEVLSRSDATVRIRVGATPVDVVRYPYATLDPPEPGPHGFPVAGPRDLGAMKVAAISRRGLRRDFWDLHALAVDRLPLRASVAAYEERYRVDRTNLYHVLRSLTYFDDAEKDPVFPAGLTPAAWDDLKVFFRREVPRLLLEGGA